MSVEKGSKVLVSVVIPTRDRWELAARALSSVLGQVDVDLEAVVVDDGSTSAPAQHSAELDDGRVTKLRNERSQGVARARNRGIAEARGEWIAFLDDDDIWAPTKLRSQLSACAAADADFSYTGLVTTDWALETRKASRPPAPSSIERDLLGMNVIGPPSSVIAHRSLLERVGDFDPSFSILADWDLWLRLAAGGRAAACAEPLTAYLTHPSNMHLDVDGALDEFWRLKRKHADLAAAAGRKLGDERWWGWIASSSRRSGRRYRGAALFLWLSLRLRRPRLAARAGATLLGDRVSAPIRTVLPVGPATSASPLEAAWLDAFSAVSLPPSYDARRG